MTVRATHRCGTHQAYKLSCEDYDDLHARAAGACQRCSRAVRLVVDHDHVCGVAAVRGLICDRCNTRLGRVDRGLLAPDALDARYLADAWHLTRGVAFERGNTKIRGVRVDDALWVAAQRKARRRRETVADVIRRALLEYAGDELEDDE